ncbi:hypothetical protein PWT90_02828 [Aphanocladium album]|nr:hypothetical protein PWT90_02828 [Aphanocladium album]
MSATKEFTFQDVAEHNTKKDCFLVVHDKVYDCSKFIDEHPTPPRLSRMLATLTRPVRLSTSSSSVP